MFSERKAGGQLGCKLLLFCMGLSKDHRARRRERRYSDPARAAGVLVGTGPRRFDREEEDEDEAVGVR